MLLLLLLLLQLLLLLLLLLLHLHLLLTGWVFFLTNFLFPSRRQFSIFNLIFTAGTSAISPTFLFRLHLNIYTYIYIFFFSSNNSLTFNGIYSSWGCIFRIWISLSLCRFFPIGQAIYFDFGFYSCAAIGTCRSTCTCVFIAVSIDRCWMMIFIKCQACLLIRAGEPASCLFTLAHTDTDPTDWALIFIHRYAYALTPTHVTA